MKYFSKFLQKRKEFELDDPDSAGSYGFSSLRGEEVR